MILSKTILENPDAVAEQLNHYEETVSPAIFEAYIAVLRTQIANEVSFKFHENGKKGAIDAATGVGKSYFAIKECIDLVSKRPQAKILLVVPTEELRDNNWKDEFEKWGAIDIYNNNLKR